MARTDNIWQAITTYISTTSPAGYDILINGTNKYLNFNTVSGSTGYGFRDNNGSMEFKNSGGSWAAFGSGGGLSKVTTDATLTGEGTPDSPLSAVGVGSDEKVKYDAADPTAGYLGAKVVAGTGITVAEGTGADENKLVITNSSPSLGGDVTWGGNANGVKKTIGSNDNFGIGFETNGTEKLTILAGGNVGIGTTGPLSLLHVKTASTASGAVNIGVFGSSEAAGDVVTESIVKIVNGFNADGGKAGTAFYTAKSGNDSNYGVSKIGSVRTGNGTSDLIFYSGSAANTETEQMRILANGNVGIGTTSPGAKLDVSTTAIIGSGSGTGALTIGNVLANSGSKLTMLGYLNTYKNWQIGNGLPTGGVFSITPSTTNGGSTFTTPALSIDTNGNVGVGMTNPNGKLNIVSAQSTGAGILNLSDNGGNNNSYLNVYNNPSAWVVATSKNGSGVIRPIRFSMNDYGDATSGVSLSLETNGNVGIGTTSPTAYLHLKAGTATAGTAPIKLTSGVVNTTPESGTIEFDGTDWYLTI